MKKTIFILLALAVIRCTGAAAMGEAPTTTTSTVSTTTTTLAATLETRPLTQETTTTTQPPYSPGALISPAIKSRLLDKINLLLDTAGNYRRDRSMLSKDYTTYIHLLRDAKGKENTSSKAIWADIKNAEYKTMREHEEQLDKLIKDLRDYVQDLN